MQARRLAAIDGLELSSDLAAHAAEARVQREKRDLRHLAAHSLAALPTEWRGKRYKRTEALSSEKERENAEAGERARWSRELAGLLAEAKLPYAATAAAQSTEPDQHRCCRGLAARTLEQRISCWRPFHQWLQTTSGVVWPQGSSLSLSISSLGRPRAQREAPTTRCSRPSPFLSKPGRSRTGTVFRKTSA